MRSPAKENRAGTATAGKRAAQGAPQGSPARKKLSKKDRRRVSFAPDPELTLIHHFVKDDDYTSNSDGQGRVVVAAYEEDTVAPAQLQQRQQQHPALVGAGEPGGGGGYRPGFWNKTVPEHSALGGLALPEEDEQQQQEQAGEEEQVPESPGMVSMEITEPMLAAGIRQQQQQQYVPGEVTAGLPSLGALAEADELEEEEEAEEEMAAAAAAQHQHAPSEVTAALPGLGALAEEDEWEAQGQGVQQAAGWAGAVAEAEAAGNTTANITSALPGLGALVEEDEDDVPGMELTAPTGRVLEQLSPQLAATAPLASPSPAATAVAAPSPAAQEMAAQGRQQAQAQPAAPEAAELAEVEYTGPITRRRSSLGLGRRSSVGRASLGGTDELVRGEAAKAAQMSKWGFAPGQEDTLDINLEMHGKLIMGDQTFNRMYCDNTTGEGGYGRTAAAGDDTTNSPLVMSASASAGLAPAAAAPSSAAAEPSPAVSQGARRRSAGASPAVSQGRQQAAGAGAAAAAPNWTAPAFLPPYLAAPAASGAPSDHPALVQSPNISGSSLNTLETRRVSVGIDVRRASINSRRFSMQDATGRLLDDDILGPGGPAAAGHASPQLAVAPATVAAAPPSAVSGDAPASGAARPRRRSSGAAFLGRDMTEKLLVDDESLDGDVGPLADLKRQMRMLSQGSPVLVPQPAAAPAAEPIAEEATAQVAAEEVMQEELEAEQGSLGAGAAAVAAKTPRAAVSMGYADSHNPATAALLRTGGTTRLLAESIGVVEEEDEEEDVLADDGEDAGERGGAGGSLQEQLQRADAGGMTARTNGTTKLLADMTMASMVGAKMLGQPGQGTPQLGRAPSNDGLTDFSLDEFEAPPELPGQQQRQRATASPAVQAQQGQLDVAMEGEEADAELQQHASGEHAEGYASPALAPGGFEFASGYPVAQLAAEGEAIPGGPKLARTPVPTRPASLPRTAHAGTPHSMARSQHSLPYHHHPHATPGTHGTHGTHRLARTPGTVPPTAAYPIDADATADNVIPGGPKLARTPMGRTPATGGYRSAGPAVLGSAVAQHYPGSARAVHFAAGPGPGSASLQRYPPGSAVAAHRAGGMTPQYSAPPPMTFQDFARLAEVQFLDNLRRGASINYADLQRNPVPASLAEAYRLLAITSPQVTTLENGIRILQEEVQARRVTAADAEQLVGQVNPAAFQKAASADEEGLEALRHHSGLLKKVCRQKAVYCLKDVRMQMEESRGGRLRRNLEALQGDLSLALGCKEQLEGVQRAAEQYITEQHRRMAQEDEALQREAELRASVADMQQAAAEESAANEGRRRRLAEAQERVAKLREEHGVLQREREALASRTDALQMTLMQSQGQAGGLGHDSSPAAILRKMEEVDTLKRCAGWEVESAAEDPVSADVALRLADLFRLRLSISRTGASAGVEALPEGECKVPADQRALLAALAGCADGASAEVQSAEASAPAVSALVQATAARLSRVADLAGELDGLRLAFPALTDVACSADGCVALSFVNLDAEVKFSVSLRLPQAYPLGPVGCQARIWFGDDGQISQQSIAQAVAAAPEAPGRLRAICVELSRLAREAMPRPALGPAAFHSGWENPLFGSTPALSAQS